MKRQMTRKEFLLGTTSVFGASMVIGASARHAESGQARPFGAAANLPVATWPWPYRKLDRDDVLKRGHKSYYDGGCSYGAFDALLQPLIETVGEPFTRVPPQIMYYGSGGGAGWGMLCGALNGAAALISLVLNRSTASTVISELFGWYTETEFPSDLSNDYGERRMFLVNKVDQVLPQTACGSPLCHASVTAWCNATHIESHDARRKERCARLTGDVAAKTVELLNAYADGQFRATFIAPRSVIDCGGCHASAIGNVEPTVKMDCQQCHRDDWKHLY